MYGGNEGENRYVFRNLLPKFAKGLSEGQNYGGFFKGAVLAKPRSHFMIP